jgi:hypothetical protein
MGRLCSDLRAALATGRAIACKYSFLTMYRNRGNAMNRNSVFSIKTVETRQGGGNIDVLSVTNLICIDFPVQWLRLALGIRLCRSRWSLTGSELAAGAVGAVRRSAPRHSQPPGLNCIDTKGRGNIKILPRQESLHFSSIDSDQCVGRRPMAARLAAALQASAASS